MYTNLSLLRSLSIGGRFFTCFHRIKNEKMIRDQTYNKKALFRPVLIRMFTRSTLSLLKLDISKSLPREEGGNRKVDGRSPACTLDFEYGSVYPETMNCTQTNPSSNRHYTHSPSGATRQLPPGWSLQDSHLKMPSFS